MSFTALLLVDIWLAGGDRPGDNSLPVKAGIKLFLVYHFTANFSDSRAGRGSRDYPYLFFAK